MTTAGRERDISRQILFDVLIRKKEKEGNKTKTNNNKNKQTNKIFKNKK